MDRNENHAREAMRRNTSYERSSLDAPDFRERPLDANKFCITTLVASSTRTNVWLFIMLPHVFPHIWVNRAGEVLS